MSRIATYKSSEIVTVASDYLHRTNGLLKTILTRPQTAVYFGFLAVVGLMAVFGPHVAPYGHNEIVYANGQIVFNAPPSLAHPLGTTSQGYDVFSRLLYGARPTAIVGLVGGSLIISIGLTVGLVSGYVGGKTDEVFMRITDFVYGIPLIPFAIVLLSFVGVSFINSVLVIGVILWRGSARVIRAQVLQIKERPFIRAAKTTGASPLRIVLVHILPNVAPMAVLFFALGVGYSIIIQAGLAFLGLSDPFVPSWGIMVRNAYRSGQISSLWWWSLPPGFMISLTVLSTFMFGRNYEALISDSSGDESLSQMG